jgi:hypothetical protein
MVNILARNQLIGHLDLQLQQLKVLADKEPMTKEEIAEMNKKNSSK